MVRHLPILPVVLSLTGALLVPVVALVSRRALWPLAVATAGACAAAGAAGLAHAVAAGPLRYPVGGWAPPWGIEVVLDLLSGFVATTVAGVTTLTLLAAGPGAGPGSGARATAFYALALVALAGFLGMIVSGDLFNVFVFLEIASIASYALVASGGGHGLAAAFRYLVLGTVGASFYLLGVGFLYALTGTLNMADLAAQGPAVAASPLFVGGMAFLAVGLALKMGLFPLHGWLPDAYTHAPLAVSGFLAPVATKATAYVLARALLYVLHPRPPAVGAALAWAGAAAVVAGGVLAARQSDARRLLAYSSVSQIGYIALGLGLGTPSALVGAYLQILSHAVAKAALFVALGTAVRGGRGPALAALALGPDVPVTRTAALLGVLSLAGVPPTGGFFAKWYLLDGALAAGRVELAAGILLGSVLAVAYGYRLTAGIWFEPGSGTARGPEGPRPALLALGVLAVATVAVGLANAPLVTAVLGPAAPARR